MIDSASGTTASSGRTRIFVRTLNHGELDPLGQTATDGFSFSVGQEEEVPFMPENTLDKAEGLMNEAQNKVTGERQDDYGDPRKNFTRIASLWESYLGTEIRPSDVAALFMLAKLSRLANTIDHEDSWVDLIGYSALGGALVNE